MLAQLADRIRAVFSPSAWMMVEDGEVVVFSWLIWPDKKTADDAWAKMEKDPAFADMDMPFDGKRMMWGGFETVFQN